MMVSISEDFGKTWLPPVLMAETPAGSNYGHRAFKFGPKGDLGFIWKQVSADRTYELWSAVSRDGGRTFKSVKVSHAPSPPINPERGNFMFGDDLSSVDLDDQYLHTVWGDNRSGFQATWYGRVPLSAY
jgi:hypothetical protein